MAGAQTSPQSQPTLQDVSVRDNLIANQESLLNTYRCQFNIDTHAVPGGCANGQPTRGPTTPGTFQGSPTQQDVAVRDNLIANQESLLNTYRCQFNIDTQIVPGGCPNGPIKEIVGSWQLHIVVIPPHPTGLGTMTRERDLLGYFLVAGDNNADSQWRPQLHFSCAVIGDHRARFFAYERLGNTKISSLGTETITVRYRFEGQSAAVAEEWVSNEAAESAVSTYPMPSEITANLRIYQDGWLIMSFERPGERLIVRFDLAETSGMLAQLDSHCGQEREGRRYS